MLYIIINKRNDFFSIFHHHIFHLSFFFFYFLILYQFIFNSLIYIHRSNFLFSECIKNISQACFQMKYYIINMIYKSIFLFLWIDQINSSIQMISCYSRVVREDWGDWELDSDCSRSNRTSNERDWSMQWIIQNLLWQSWNLSTRSTNSIDRIHRWNQITCHQQSSSILFHVSSLVFFYISCNFFINFSYSTW